MVVLSELMLIWKEPKTCCDTYFLRVISQVKQLDI